MVVILQDGSLSSLPYSLIRLRRTLPAYTGFAECSDRASIHLNVLLGKQTIVGGMGNRGLRWAGAEQRWVGESA